MANESTYSGISALVGNVYEIALQTLREGNIMAPLVTTWSDKNDSQPREWSNYSGGTFATVGETDDMTAQAFTAATGGTATPVTYGQMMFLTDRRIRTDVMNAQADAGLFLGGLAAEHVDKNLVGGFSSFTAGTAGTAGGTLTWTNVMRGAAYLRENKVPAPYYCVLHPVQWHYLASAASGVPSLIQVDSIASSLIGQFYQGSFSGINFFVDANITSGTAAVGGIFGRQAIYLDRRQPFGIEYQRDASRGAGGWELNATMEYAYGVWRPTLGAQLKGTSI